MGLHAQSLNQYPGAGGRVKLVEWEGAMEMCLWAKMELVFDRLARAACLWRWASLSFAPHSRNRVCMQIQRTVFLGRKYKVRWQEAEAEVESELAMLGCVMLQSGQIQFVPSRAAQLAKRDWLFGCCCRNCLPLDPICSSGVEASEHRLNGSVRSFGLHNLRWRAARLLTHVVACK